MQTLDTNVLVRHLAQDDAEQSSIASKVIAEATAEESLFVPLSVIVELEWVLRSKYQLNKADFIYLLSDMLDTRQFRLQEEASVERALHYFRHTSADFADCLHTASAFSAAALPLLTFDRAASRLEGVSLLTR